MTVRFERHASPPGSKKDALRVLHITDSAFPSSQCTLLHHELRNRGVESQLLCVKSSNVRNATHLSWWDRILYSLANRLNAAVMGLAGGAISGISFIDPIKLVRRANPDVVHVHVANSGLLNWAKLSEWSGPIVISLHDLWPVHILSPFYSDAIMAQEPFALSVLKRYVHSTKRWSVGRDNVYFVAPSKFIITRLKFAPLKLKGPVVKIGNIVNVETHAPLPMQEARAKLGLRQDKKILGIVAHRTSPEKGMELVEIVKRHLPNWCIASCGGQRVGGADVTLGPLSMDEMRSFYSAVDVLLLPSHFESFSQTAAEAVLCGCPVVADKAGGFLDFVVPGEGGEVFSDRSGPVVAQAIWTADALDRSTIAAEASRRLQSDPILDQWLVLYHRAVQESSSRGRSAAGKGCGN